MRGVLNTAAVLVTAAIVGACGGDSTGPQSRVPALGRYSYRSEWTGTGTLTITFASPDSVAGTWEVTQPDRTTATSRETSAMRGPVRLGLWNLDAYVLYGELVIAFQSQSTGPVPLLFRTQYAHRITWNGERATCTVQEVLNSQRGRVPCTLTYLGR